MARHDIAPNPEAKLQIGEMPKPRYVPLGDEKWIGIEAYSSDGEFGEFLWWRNIPEVDINDIVGREQVAALVARIKIQYGIDAAIGMPVDFKRSNPQSGKVRQRPAGELGVYIEQRRREGFGFFYTIGGLKSEEELREKGEMAFEEAYQKAKVFLPRSRG